MMGEEPIANSIPPQLFDNLISEVKNEKLLAQERELNELQLAQNAKAQQRLRELVR
jgi:hypothetical protein